MLHIGWILFISLLSPSLEAWSSAIPIGWESNEVGCPKQRHLQQPLKLQTCALTNKRGLEGAYLAECEGNPLLFDSHGCCMHHCYHGRNHPCGWSAGGPFLEGWLPPAWHAPHLWQWLSGRTTSERSCPPWKGTGQPMCRIIMSIGCSGAPIHEALVAGNT